MYILGIQTHMSEENITITIEENHLEYSHINDTVIPKLAFIIPYRDREPEYKFFSQHMQNILEDIPSTDYKIYYIHQTDKRDFNRGAMKNIGFLVIKKLYPNDYKNITLVFNDIDTMPYYKNFLNYETEFNNIKHFYGFQNSLGGIFSIKAGDFEKISGFPNFWSWGYEDNLLQKRAINANMHIDRSEFYPPFDPNICHIKDSVTRTVNRKEFDRFMSDTNEGIHSIYGLEYNIDESNGFVNVTSFFTGNEPKTEFNTIHDLRNGNVPFRPLKTNGLPFDFTAKLPRQITNDLDTTTIINQSGHKQYRSMPFAKKRGQSKLGMHIT